MSGHSDMLPMIREAFADHRIKKGPGLSWRMAKPGTGTYAFRVTWAPGMLAVSGDLGEITYTVYPTFGGLWEAIEMVNGADWDYLTGKSNKKLEYDRDATVRDILRHADERMAAGDLSYWEKIVSEWHPESYSEPDPRDVTVQMEAAKGLRDSCDLTAEVVYHAFDDSELICYSYHRQTRWQYEAVRLWAAEMLRREPRWHRLWRRYTRARSALRRDLRSGLIYRPTLYERRHSYPGQMWVRHRWENGKESFRDVHRFRPFGFDLSRLGLWAFSGSNSPITEERDLRDFSRRAA